MSGTSGGRGHLLGARGRATLVGGGLVLWGLDGGPPGFRRSLRARTSQGPSLDVRSPKDRASMGLSPPTGRWPAVVQRGRRPHRLSLTRGGRAVRLHPLRQTNQNGGGVRGMGLLEEARHVARNIAAEGHARPVPVIAAAPFLVDEDLEGLLDAAVDGGELVLAVTPFTVASGLQARRTCR